MAITHAAIAVAGTSLILGTADPFSLGLAVLGSQLPDLDSTTSVVGQIFYPVSSWIEDRYPHRTITHSLLASAILTAIAVSVGFYFFQNPLIAIAFPLGHLLACFSDCFTIKGVQLFYPYPAWAVSVSNPRRRLKTGGAGELWVLAGAIALLIIGITLAGGGGITQQVTQQLGLKEGLIEIYNKEASSKEVWAIIEGVRGSDRSPISGRYLILGVEGSDFIVTDGKEIYQTGKQIIPSKLNTETGKPATTQIQNLTFNDENAIASLTQLSSNFPQAQIYLTGTLQIDLPDDVKLPNKSDQYPSAALTGTTLKLDYLPIENAIAILNDQYAIGSLSAKIITGGQR